MVFYVKNARSAQKRLSEMAREERLAKDPDLVCGMDVAYVGDKGFGAAVVLSYPDLSVLEVQVSEGEAPVPYMPTFLAFREMPFLFRLMKRMKVKPDVFMVDGHGLWHPRRCGLATHFGVVFKVPTIGVAKERLRVRGSEVVGDSVVVGGKVLGKMLGDVYVSVGNRITLDEGAEIVSKCLKGRKIPEPIHLAHKIANEAAERVRLG